MIEISVVIPCLNEAKTIGVCVGKAVKYFKDSNVKGEVVVCDNGSSDGSDGIARKKGARVVHEKEKGYGRAYLKGLDEARGRYIIIGDADNTYDFTDLSAFIEPLRKGFDFVNGTRLKGKILKGAMPWLHQYIGNPFLSWFLNLLYGPSITDAYCGMKAFTRKTYEKIRPISIGMEFALELLINAARKRLRIQEVPITYYPRAGGISKLRTFVDGWRSLRFMLIFSPTHLFLVPGGMLFVVGAVLLISLVFGSMKVFGHTFDLHAMIFGSFLSILGVQVVSFALLARTYAFAEKFEVHDPFIKWFYRMFDIEKGVLGGSMLFFLGVIMDIFILLQWIEYGPLPRERFLILSLTIMIIGGQVIFTSLFGSLLGLPRHRRENTHP